MQRNDLSHIPSNPDLALSRFPSRRRRRWKRAAVKRFFCLRGYMKSGTNWVCNLLNLHPSISCVGEFHWQHIFDSLQRNFQYVRLYQNAEFRANVTAHFEAAVRNSLLELADPEALVVGDRTPAPIRPIVFRGAPHICVIRDGRDVLISRMFHLFNHSSNPMIQKTIARQRCFQKLLAKHKRQADYFEQHPHDLLTSEFAVRSTAKSWARSIRDDRATAEEEADLPILFVRYEDLHRDTEAMRSTMYEFLGLDASQSRPLDNLTRAGFSVASPTEFYRKGQVGDWRNFMTDTARSWFNEEAGEELISLGYASAPSW